MKQCFVKRNSRFFFETKALFFFVMPASPVTHAARRARTAPAKTARAVAPVAEARAKETADLTLRLLEYLAENAGQSGVTELAEQFGCSKATIYRHLQILMNRQFVTQDRLTQRYEISIRLFQLGELLRDRFDIVGAARADMNRLRDECGQAVTITTLNEDQVVVMELVQGRTVVEFGTRRGTAMALHCSAHGKVALAFGPAEVMEQCLRAPLPALSPDTVTDPALLRRQIAQIRKQGWATAANEVIFGVNALAAPVFDHRGDFAGAVAVVGSTQHIGPKPKPEMLAQVQGAARRISIKLGFRG